MSKAVNRHFFHGIQVDRYENNSPFRGAKAPKHERKTNNPRPIPSMRRKRERRIIGACEETYLGRFILDFPSYEMYSRVFMLRLSQGVAAGIVWDRMIFVM